MIANAANQYVAMVKRLLIIAHANSYQEYNVRTKGVQHRTPQSQQSWGVACGQPSTSLQGSNQGICLFSVSQAITRCRVYSSRLTC